MRQVLITNATRFQSGALNALPLGAVALFNADTNQVIAGSATLATVPRVYIAIGMGAGKQPYKTPVFSGSDAIAWGVKAKQTPARMSQFVGFVGSGSLNIAPVNNGSYTLRVRDTSTGQEPFPTGAKTILSGSATTPLLVALELAKVHNADKARFAVVNALSDVTTTALAATRTLTTTAGSSIVVASGTDHGVTAGQVIRIGHATTKTFPVYRVVAVDGANITLDRPYVLASQPVGTVTSAVAAGAAAAPNNTVAAGLVVTAISTDTVLHISCADELAGTVVTKGTGFTPGFGTAAQIAKLESDNWGQLSYHNRVWLPQTPDSMVNTTKEYHVYNLRVNNQRKDATLMQGVVGDVFEVLICVPSDATDVITDVQTQLNTYLAPKFPAATV